MKNINRRAAISLALSAIASTVAVADETALVGTVTGRVVDTEGKPVEGATVMLLRHLKVKPWLVEVTTMTDAKGKYRFDAVAVATWELEWKKENATSIRKQTQAGFWMQNLPTEVIITPDGLTTVPDVGLRLWTTFRINVRLPGNLPAANETVYLVNAAPSISYGCFVAPTSGAVKRLQTDARGLCYLSLDPDRLYTERASDLLRFAHIPTGSFGFAPVGTKTGSSKSLTVQLMKPATITGKVVEADGKTPVGKETVTARALSATSMGELATLMQSIEDCEKETMSESEIIERAKWSENADRSELWNVMQEYVARCSPVLMQSAEPEQAKKLTALGTIPPERTDESVVGVCRDDTTGEAIRMFSHDLSCKTDAHGHFRLCLLPGVRYRVESARQTEFEYKHPDYDYGEHTPADKAQTFRPFVAHVRSGQTVSGIVLTLQGSR